MSRDSAEGSVQQYDDEECDKATNDKQGVAPADILQEIVDRKESVVVEWYDQTNKEPPRVDAFLEPNNASKNRFKGVLLYDKSRVTIKGQKGSDYYHASLVDSLEKKDGYILAQAPFSEETEAAPTVHILDFWRMVSKYKPVMVVLLGSLTGTDGNPKMKCFFPSPKQERQYFRGKLRLRCSSKDQERDHDFYSFTLLGSGQRSKNAFQVHMLQNRKWIEDKDVPDNLLDFRAVMQIHMARAINEDRADGPVLFVCPTGVHRCGTFAVLNILSDRLKEEKKVGLDETLAIVRSQRYGVVAHFDHYKVLHELTVRQAVSFGMVDTSAVGGGRRR